MGLFTRLRGRAGSALAGALHLSSGAASGQLITLVTTLVIARLYTPAELGVLSAVLSVALLISPVVTLGLQVAIVPAVTDADAVRLARLALTAVLASAVITAIALMLVPLPSPNLSERRALVVIYVPLMVLVLGTFAVLSQLSLRQRLYRAMAIRGVTQSSVTGLIQIVGSLIRPSALWLFAGELLGRAVGTASLIPQAVRFSRSVERPLPSGRAVLRRYADSVRYFLPSTTVEMAAGQVAVLAVASWFGPTQTGYLGLANRVLVLPVVLIGSAVGQVLGTELAHRRRSGNADQSIARFRQLVRGLSALSVAFAVAMFVLGPWAFSLVFGEQWRESGELARYLCIPIAVGLVWNPVSVTYPAYERLRAFLWLSILRLTLGVTAGVAVHAMGFGWIPVVVAIASGIAVAQLVGLYVAWRIVHSEATPVESTRPA